MTDLQFLPWQTPGTLCPSCGKDYEGWLFGHVAVPVAPEFRPYAAAFSNWETCRDCDISTFDLEIGIGSVCVANRDLLCDRMHTAEEISRIRLSRGREPWYADVHFDVYDVHYTGLDWGKGLDLPWLHYHYFGPFDWPEDGMMERLTRLANTVIPFLCENALVINEYAWPLRRPHGGS